MFATGDSPFAKCGLTPVVHSEHAQEIELGAFPGSNMESEHYHSFTNDLTDIGQLWVDHCNGRGAESVEGLISKQTFDVCERLEAILAEVHQLREQQSEVCARLEDIVGELREHNSREDIGDANT